MAARRLRRRRQPPAARDRVHRLLLGRDRGRHGIRGGAVAVRRTLVAAAAAFVLFASAGGEAHKPITSPFTFNDDVLPIVQAKCGACHVAGGVAPMSLLTHGDTVPWGESIRAELMAGHMPPRSEEHTSELQSQSNLV